MPYFTIIIPTHNRAHRLPKALESILAQTYENWECIIVDDASTDNTEEVIKHYIKDSRFHYIKNAINQERCNSRNIGIKAAKGAYICFLDSDDYHLPDHLSSFYSIIKEQNEPKAFIFSKAWNETEDGQRTERTCPDFSVTDPYSYFLRYTVNPQRWCVHRDIFKQVQFDPNVTICEDMDTSLRIVKAGFPIIYIPQRTTIYVAASDSFTHGDANKASKELFYLKRIFTKPELKPHLPKKETNRLLSMCHFHLAQKAIAKKQRWEFYKHALRSFVLCPKGYNGKTNKILLVNAVYFLPGVGWILRKRHVLFSARK
jgi:glycosyltransferase involved in cell wall biosynthesis